MTRCVNAATDIDGLPLQRTVDQFLRVNEKKAVKILEAGCGSATHIDVGSNVWLVGIDISKEQLQRNSALQEKIVGDIQSFELEQDAYDMIVCWNVLEHLPYPHKALANMARAVREGGIIILRYPNPLSAQGLLAKFTPHIVHVWAYRHLLDRPWAGVKGQGPFPTFMRFSIRLAAVRRFASKHNLVVQTCSTFDRNRPPRIKETRPRLYVILTWLSGCIRVATLGSVSSRGSGCLVVLRKPARLIPHGGQAVHSVGRTSGRHEQAG